MHTEGSWSMTESHGPALQVALYVRDAVGLAYGVVPPLAPAVAGAADEPPTEDDVLAWRAWFTFLLAAEATGVPDDPLGLLLAAGPTPRLGTAATERFEEAQAWCAARKADHIENLRTQTHEQRVVVTRLVAEVEWGLGRRAAPFTLNLVTLSVAGWWSHRARHDLLLLSTATRYDEPRLRAVLTPVVRELAR